MSKVGVVLGIIKVKCPIFNSVLIDQERGRGGRSGLSESTPVRSEQGVVRAGSRPRRPQRQYTPLLSYLLPRLVDENRSRVDDKQEVVGCDELGVKRDSK